MKICIVEGCESSANKADMCNKHYLRVKRNGHPNPTRMTRLPGQLCSECDNPVCARGFCSKHYHRWRVYGNPHTIKLPMSPRSRSRFPIGHQPQICTMTDCGVHAFKQGWCKSHYRYWLLYGDPLQTGKAVCPVCRERNYTTSIGHGCCGECYRTYQRRQERGYSRHSGEAFWTKELCLEAGRAWIQENTQIPISNKWHLVPDHDRYPSTSTVLAHFGKWSDFLIALSLEPRLNKPSRSHHKHYNAKLTWEQAQAIRQEYGLGNIYQRELATRYGVSLSCINSILTGRRWQDAP